MRAHIPGLLLSNEKLVYYLQMIRSFIAAFRGTMRMGAGSGDKLRVRLHQIYALHCFQPVIAAEQAEVPISQKQGKVR